MKKSNEAEIIQLGILYLTDCVRMSRHQEVCLPCRLWKHCKSSCDRKDAPAVHLLMSSTTASKKGPAKSTWMHCHGLEGHTLRACLLGRASSQRNSHNLPSEV